MKKLLVLITAAVLMGQMPAVAQPEGGAAADTSATESTSPADTGGGTGGAAAPTDQAQPGGTSSTMSTTGGATGGAGGTDAASTMGQPSDTSSTMSTGGAGGGAAGGTSSTMSTGGAGGGAAGGTSSTMSTGGGATGGASQPKTPQKLPFAVYVDQGSRDNHFIPSGWMGDYGDIKLNPGGTQSPHSGKTTIQVNYTAKMTQGAGWAGVFWQHPANNWGDKQGGFNLTGATKLTFWAKGAKGGEKIAEFKMGGITGEYPDSDSAQIGPLELTNEWKQYSIDLKGKDLSNIIGGFAWSASKDDNPNGFTIFIDDIMYE